MQYIFDWANIFSEVVSFSHRRYDGYGFHRGANLAFLLFLGDRLKMLAKVDHPLLRLSFDQVATECFYRSRL